MSVVSIAEAWPAPGKPFTVAHLDRMPDDARRYEIVDGSLVVSPRPSNQHQEVAAELLGLLRAGCPAGLRVLPEPAVQLSQKTQFAPALVVIREAQVTGAKCTEQPLLVVEMRSPIAVVLDRKKAAYERFGVESYWVVVPDPDEPEVIVFELNAGRYQEAARVTGDETFAAVRPFSVEIVPSRLVAELQP
jgi:Uma2 family endonuclease